MVGDKTLARSVTQAWISEATVESLLSPMVVPYVFADQGLNSGRGGLAVRSGRCPLAGVLAHCDRVRVADVRT